MANYLLINLIKNIKNLLQILYLGQNITAGKKLWSLLEDGKKLQKFKQKMLF